MNLDVTNNELRRIRDKYESSGSYNNHSEAKFIVQESRSKQAILHDHFEWDDSEAGEKFRIIQARQLIIRVKIVNEASKENKNIRAFINIKKTDEAGKAYRVYEHIDTILEDQSMTEAMLKSAYDDLRVWANRYRNLKELAEIIYTADQLLLNLEEVEISF